MIDLRIYELLKYLKAIIIYYRCIFSVWRIIIFIVKLICDITTLVRLRIEFLD